MLLALGVLFIIIILIIIFIWTFIKFSHKEHIILSNDKEIITINTYSSDWKNIKTIIDNTKYKLRAYKSQNIFTIQIDFIEFPGEDYYMNRFYIILNGYAYILKWKDYIKYSLWLHKQMIKWRIDGGYNGSKI